MAFCVALVLLAANAIVSVRATRDLVESDRRVAHSHEVITEIEATLSSVKDAETGQRGFLITGRDEYRLPYDHALDTIGVHLNTLSMLTAGDPRQQGYITTLRANIADKLAELAQTVELRQNRGFAAAAQVVQSDRGHRLMTQIRATADGMETREAEVLQQRRSQADRSRDAALETFALATFLAVSLTCACYVASIIALRGRDRYENQLSLQREWLEVTLSSIGDAVIATDLDSRITFLNSVAANLMGWSAAEAIGHPLTDFFRIINEETRDTVESPVDKVLEQGIVVGLANHTLLIARDGSETPIDDSAAPIRGEDEELRGVVLVFRDVSERKEIEREREAMLASERAARLDAEEANSAKDQFLATTSHELRTPLTAILGWAHLMRSSKLDDATVEHALDTIDRNARSQQKIIEDILDISRVVSGTLRLELQVVDLRQVLEAALDSVMPTATAKAIIIEPLFEDGSCLVAGDSGRLQQVVWNLLSNAIKFSPKGGRVTVSLARDDSYLQVKVIDSGQGIPAKFLPYVFDRFSQADSTPTRKHGGLGLGLSIVRHLVELHGGRVWAQSDGDGHGATFTVDLPVTAMRDVRVPEEPAPSPMAPGPMPGTLGAARILLVDDEPDVVEILTVTLERSGAVVRSATSARAALELLEEWLPDAIVSDLHMPDKDGYSFIQEVRRLHPDRGGNLPVLALTADTRDSARTRAQESGFQAFLTKPVDSQELLEALRQLLHRK